MLAPGKFRTSALKRLNSPEQLDQLLRVAPARRWFALSGLLLLVAAAIVWSVASSVPTTLSGTGYLLPEGGLRKISASQSGTVENLNMSNGQHVVAGETLADVRTQAGAVVPLRSPETGVLTEQDISQNSYVTAGGRVGLVQPVGFPLVIYAYVKTNIAADLRPGTPAQVVFGAGIGQAYGYAEATVASVSQFAVTGEHLDFILQDASVIKKVLAQGPTNEVVLTMNLSADTPSGFVWGSGRGPSGPLPAGLPAQVTFVIGQHHPISNVL